MLTEKVNAPDFERPSGLAVFSGDRSHPAPVWVDGMRQEICHFHLFCGLGGAARGFQRGEARVGTAAAEFRCLGGVDVDPAACRDFEHLAKARATCLDLFDREQYVEFHGCEPPEGWREATVDDIRAAAGGEHPHILFTSPPCKGFSGLLSQARSQSTRYQALNRLTIRGLMLALEAWGDDPPELVLLENVPRIANRGRRLLDAIVALLESHGYAVAETTHDCGELGGLAQTRKRFLLVARHQDKVPPFLYQPRRKPLRGVGEVLGQMPLPDDETAGPLHRMRRLQWRTWVRLAFVEAGGDWRSLERLQVADGVLADFALVPTWNGEYGQLGVKRWEETANAVSGQSLPGGGRYSVADPRTGFTNAYHNNLRVVSWKDPSGAVIGASRPDRGGAGAVADPRLGCDAGNREHRRYNNVYKVIRWDDTSPAVTGGTGPSAGGVSVADPRPTSVPRSGVYGVTAWNDHATAVTGCASHDNGAHSVADPRLPSATEQLVALIIAEDGTWHRPFTTLELAALQGLVDPDEHLDLDGRADTAWRERIGNAVPAPTAAAIASVMAQTLLLARAGETFVLSAEPIWVRRLMAAVAS